MFKDEFSTERKVHLINRQVYVTQSVYEHVCRRLYDKYICIHGIYLLMQARCDLIHFPALLTDAFCSFTYTIVLLKKSSIGKKNILSSLSSSLFFRVLSLSLVSFSHTIASLTKKKHCQSILMISLNFFIQSTCTRKITHN